MTSTTTHESLPPLELHEHGRAADGSPATLDRRLFFQLLAFTDCAEPGRLAGAVQDAGIEGVLYENVLDPRGVGLLTMSEHPAFFLDVVRRFLGDSAFGDLTPDPRYTMFGRTYSIGYESDLEGTLIHRPRARVLNPAWPWAIWYPLRRSGAFERLPAAEQRSALMEHGGIGRRFGESGLASDIRLACHGIDVHDNDFVVGLLGPQLHPLSALVHAMRRTVQTSVYVERMGPFFVGRAVRPGVPA